MRGIYVASKTSHAALWRDRRDAGWPIISTWIDEAGEGESSCLKDLWTRCVSEAQNAGAVILYHQHADTPLKGALVEVGAALACRVPVFAVSDALPLLGSFVHHPLVMNAGSIEGAFIRAYAALHPAANPAGADGGEGATMGEPDAAAPAGKREEGA